MSAGLKCPNKRGKMKRRNIICPVVINEYKKKPQA
jgi:hypothetical protein